MSVTNGIERLAPNEYAIIIDGHQVDIAYGNEWQAWDCHSEWVETLANDKKVVDNLSIPYWELFTDDNYWKNGFIEPLRIE